MWIAKDIDGTITLYLSKPIKDKRLGIWYSNDTELTLGEEIQFPEISWEDIEPTKVDIVIKK